MRKTYQGSCHCGAVRFEADLDLATANSNRCNCSICRRQRFWKALVKAEDFRLQQGAEALNDYQFGSRTVHHLFCGICGVRSFGRSYLDVTFKGERMQGEYYAVNVACLDATDEELAAAPVHFEDGRNDDWESAPTETRYL